MKIMYKHIFLNFDELSFINKEMVSLFQMHTYKFGLVYLWWVSVSISDFMEKCENYRKTEQTYLIV